MAVITLEELRGALARGYCHTMNRNKELDSDLLIAQEKELIKILPNIK